MGCDLGAEGRRRFRDHRDRAVSSDSKSGPRTVKLSCATRAVIDAVLRCSEDYPYLFPAHPPTRHIDTISGSGTAIATRRIPPLLQLHRTTVSDVVAADVVEPDLGTYAPGASGQ